MKVAIHTAAPTIPMMKKLFMVVRPKCMCLKPLNNSMAEMIIDPAAATSGTQFCSARNASTDDLLVSISWSSR